MIETTNMTGGTRSLAIHAEHNELAGDYCERERRADYYRAYYRALVEEHARSRSSSSNSEVRRGGLGAIKMRRRKVRREKWLQGVKSLVAGVLKKSEALN